MIAWIVAAFPLTAISQPAPSTANASPMQSLLEEKLAANPHHADTWRLLGRVHRKQDNVPGALDAFGQAVRLDPQNTAAHHDLGWLLDSMGRYEEAAFHFRRVAELAPESEYANSLPPGFVSQMQPPVELAGYEITRFDHSAESQEDTQRLEDRLEEPIIEDVRPYSVYLETGGMYNTNVTLTPITQELFSADAASFQGFLSPRLEYRLFEGRVYSHGPVFAGYFNINENQFQDFNLESYQGGYFFERLDCSGAVTLISRSEYTYILDRLGGARFGDRHGLTLSSTAVWESGNVTHLFYSVHFSDFLDDGAIPTEDSLDGWTHGFGASHVLFFQRRFLESISIGADAQLADIEGANFRYNGFSLYADATIPLGECCSLLLEGGWGYRDYYAFTGTPSRDEMTWRGGVKLKRQITDYLSLSGVLSYERFDSENEEFESERWLTGVVTTLEF